MERSGKIFNSFQLINYFWLSILDVWHDFKYTSEHYVVNVIKVSIEITEPYQLTSSWYLYFNLEIIKVNFFMKEIPII